MKMLLQRRPSTANCTIGDLSIDGRPECHILEDVVREVFGVPVEKWKVYGKTAIPQGTYDIVVDFSPRFKRFLPHILNVPGFSGVRIHPGNTDADTDGCLLPGTWKSGERVNNSREAFSALIHKIDQAKKRGEKVAIEIRNPQELMHVQV